MLVTELLLSYYKTQCLYVISELDIANELRYGPKSAKHLAEFKSVNADKLYRILRFLASQGLFKENEEGLFELNDESKKLLHNEESALKNFIKLHATCFYQSAEEIINAIATDASPFELKYNAGAHSYFLDNPMFGDMYNTAMSENSQCYSQLLLAIYDFSSYGKIIDIGGGFGTLLILILQKYQNTIGIVFDLPQLKSKAEENIVSNRLGERCRYISGSFFESIPEGGDIYILKAILHGKNDHMAMDILNNIKVSMKQDSKILIIDRLIDRECDYELACINDINMLNVTRGFDRTKQQFECLIKACGLFIQNIYYLEDAHFCIEIQL